MKGLIDESRYDGMKKDYSYAYHERKNYLNELYDKKKKKYEKSIDLNSISNIII